MVSIVGCTGDWTGGWHNVEPDGADRFITEDLTSGRMIDVIDRGEPAMMVCHWTGIHWNGEERGFKVFQEVVRRLKAKYSNLVWMKLSELARYWAAKELTQVTRQGNSIRLFAPFAASGFTMRVPRVESFAPTLHFENSQRVLSRVSTPLNLVSDTFAGDEQHQIICFDLPKGKCAIKW